MVPSVGFPPETPFTLQDTAVFDVPVTVAVNCCVFPSNTLELEDETMTVATEAGGFVMVSEAVPLIPLSAAVIVALPGVTAVANPPAPIVAFEVADHSTVFVTSFELPSA